MCARWSLHAVVECVPQRTCCTPAHALPEIAGVLASAPSQAAPITYTLNTYSGMQFYPPFNDTATITVNAHIKTDGVVGKLALADIVAFDFHFTIADKTGTVTQSFDNTDTINWAFFQGQLTATKKGLFFDFSVANNFPIRNVVDLIGKNAAGTFSEFILEGPPGGVGSGDINITTLNAGQTLNLGVTIPKTGNQQIATTPLPSALPLFAGGLGLLGCSAGAAGTEEPNRQPAQVTIKVPHEPAHLWPSCDRPVLHAPVLSDF
jgi:hypothetical protein